MKLCQNVNSHKSKSSSKLGHVGLKTMSLGQIMKKPRLIGQIVENPYVHSRGHICDPKFIILCLNVNPHNINVEFGIGSCWVKN